MIYLVETNGNSNTDVYICLHTFILAGNIQNHLHGIRLRLVLYQVLFALAFQIAIPNE